MRIETVCGGDAGSDSSLLFQFCSDGNCCSTAGIMLTNGNDYSFDCANADWFEDSKLGSCKGLRIDQKSEIIGQVSYSWMGETSYNGDNYVPQ